MSALRKGPRRLESIFDIAITGKECGGRPGPWLAVTLRRMRRLWAAFENTFSSATSPMSLSSGVVERLLCEQSVSEKEDVLEELSHVAEREVACTKRSETRLHRTIFT